MFLRHVRMIGRVSDSIFKPIMVNTVSFLPRTTLKFHIKYQICLGTLSAQKMENCATSRGTHCCLNCLMPSIDVWGWLEELMTASTSPIWSTSCPFYWKQFSNFMENVRFGYPLRTGNRIMCIKERHTLLLEWSITFLRYIRMIRKSFYHHLQAPCGPHHVIFYQKQLSNFMQNIRIRAPSQH